jgi:hypothetical protein
MRARILSGAVAVAVIAVVAAGGCGSDDEEATSSPTTTTSTAAALQDCPDIATGVGPVTAVRATVDCAEVTPLAEDVLSRDDCVEETEDGVNDCTSGEFECETTIDRAPGERFVVRCTSGADRAEFEYALGAPEGSGQAGDAPPEPEPQELTTFSTPSGNIGCVMDPGYVRCDISERSWESPAGPADCELDHGHGIEISDEQRARFVCAGDTTLGAEDVLEYGEASRVGPYRCVSAAAGLNCQAESGHGFFLSKQDYELY